MVFSWCAFANTSHLLCSSNVKTGKIEIKFMIILSTVCECRVADCCYGSEHLYMSGTAMATVE